MPRPIEELVREWFRVHSSPFEGSWPEINRHVDEEINNLSNCDLLDRISDAVEKRLREEKIS